MKEARMGKGMSMRSIMQDNVFLKGGSGEPTGEHRS